MFLCRPNNQTLVQILCRPIFNVFTICIMILKLIVVIL